jgi:ABC-type methionine transport system ATPase subunit
VKGGKSNQKSDQERQLEHTMQHKDHVRRLGWVEVSLAQTVTVQTRQSTDHQLSIVHGDLEYVSTSSCTVLPTVSAFPLF